MNELSLCAASLEQKRLTIGEIFTIRWVSSSELPLKAVWIDYFILYEYFMTFYISGVKHSSFEKFFKNKYEELLKDIELNLNLGPISVIFSLMTKILEY